MTTDIEQLYNRGDSIQGGIYVKESYITRIDWFEDSTQSVWNVCIKFDTWKEHWKLYVIEGKQC